jgi:thymidylate synthase ThyX
MWHTVIVTATEWDNFYALRDNSQAQPEIQRAASMMKSVQTDSIPELLYTNEWHLPLIREEDRDMPLDILKKISVGRCTRVSYLTHNGRRDPEDDIRLHDQILGNGHMSPFEHVATPIDTVTQERHGVFEGNFRGWHQYRKDIPGENDFSLLSIPK